MYLFLKSYFEKYVNLLFCYFKFEEKDYGE